MSPTYATLVLIFATRAAVAGGELAELPLPPPGTLVSAEGMPLSDARVAAEAQDAAFVLIGESHPNECDHGVQARLLGALSVHALRPPALGMEMIAVDERDAVDRFNAGALRAVDLEQALRWPETWGFPFALYRPVFEQAESNRNPLVALNAPRGIAREAARNRWTSADVNPPDLLPTEVIPPPPEERPMLVEEYEAHAAFAHRGGSGASAGATGGDEGAGLERFLYAQALWDTKMAQEAAGAHFELQRPVVVLAGGGHVEHGWGIRYRLERYAPGARVLSVLPWRGDEAPDPTAADLFFYCPEASPEAADAR